MQRVLRQPNPDHNAKRSPDGLSLADVPVRCRATSNPGGPNHYWIKAYFVDAQTRPEGVIYLPARWVDNNHIDFEEYARGLAHMPPTDRERLRNGNWDIADEGTVFRRDWFEIINRSELPTTTRAIRYWDLASAQPTPSYPDPDWTVGLRLDYDDTTRTYYITGPVRQRRHAGQIEELLRATAKDDGPGVQICVEQEPGSHSAYLEQHLKYELLHGYRITMHRPSTNKEARAGTIAAAAEQGRVKIVAGPNVRDFLDEVCQFPHGRHNDCVDALAGAQHALGRTRTPALNNSSSIVPRGSVYEDTGMGRIWSHPDWFE